MSQRIVRFVCPIDTEDIAFKKALEYSRETYFINDYWSQKLTDGRTSHSFILDTVFSQSLLDLLQQLAENHDNSRIVVASLEAVIPRIDEFYDDKTKQQMEELKQRKSSGVGRISREELYHDIYAGAQPDSNYLLMVFFSTIVAAVGLLYNDIAVIVGAMVIAPFLGPNLALSLATVLGDKKLIIQAVKSSVLGIGMSILFCSLIGYVWPYSMDGAELMRRTEVGFASIFLALSAGSAAVLSLAKGVSSALVGVMVAAALLPPVAACGLMLGSGQYYAAEGAAVLFAINIACINVAANIVFLLHGVTPKHWYEKERAKSGYIISFGFWIVVLCVLSFIIITRKEYLSFLF